MKIRTMDWAGSALGIMVLLYAVGCGVDGATQNQNAIRVAECAQQFEECVSEGGDPMLCHEAQIRCEEGGISCEAQFEVCVEGGGDPMLCHEAQLDCEGLPCEAEFNACVAAGGDPMLCHEAQIRCEEDDLSCEAQFDICVAAGGDPMLCHEVQVQCEGESLPCEAEFDACVAAGGDPMSCHEAQLRCEEGEPCSESDCGLQPPGLPCGDPAASVQCTRLGGACQWVDTCPADGEQCSAGACDLAEMGDTTCEEMLPELLCIAHERRCEWRINECASL